MPTCFVHPVDGHTILPILTSTCWPQSIAVQKRISHKHKPPNFHILSTFNDKTTASTLPKCFAIATIDRSVRPETEAYLFLTADPPSRCPPACPSCKANITTLLAHIATLPLPESVNKLSMDTAAANGLTPYAAHYARPELLLAGSVATSTAQLLAALGVVELDLPGPLALYNKFLFRQHTLPAVGGAAGSGQPFRHVWAGLDQPHYELVRRRTEIPRQDATLAVLDSVAIFPGLEGKGKGVDGAPIAWGFMGIDGSLTSMHVEEEHRGQGLAKLLAAKLLREGLGPEGVSHADVALGNLQSEGVCKSIGGEVGWQVCWLRVNLAKVRDLENK